jgi:hypothetical protein
MVSMSRTTPAVPVCHAAAAVDFGRLTGFRRVSE